MNLIYTYAGKIIPLAIALLGFCLIVVIHEFGHFLFAKLFKIHTPTFSVGFGKPIFSKKIGRTNFQIAPIPLGGYVEISGLHEVGQGEQKHAKDKGKGSFRSKPYWQQFLVLIGGVSFNALFAYLLVIACFLFGVPKTEIIIHSTEHNRAADIGGLKANDRILEIDQYDFDKQPDLWLKAIESLQQKEPNDKIKFVVLRNGHQKELYIKILKTEENHKGKLGFVVMPVSSTKEKIYTSFSGSVVKGIQTVNNYVVLTIHMIKNMFIKRTLKGVGGPVMIISMGISFVQQGLVMFLMFLAMLNIALAVFNILPLPILDGGQLCFITIEAIIRREIPIKIKETIHIASFILMLLLFVYLTYSDTLNLFGKKAN